MSDQRTEELAAPRGQRMDIDAPYARLVVLATAVVATAVGLTIGALGTSLPAMHRHLHAPLSSLGVLFGVNFFGSLLVTLWLGSRLDRHPPRPFMVGGAVVMILGLLLLPLANSLPMAVAALGLAGIGAGSNSVGSSVLTTRLFGRQDGRALSWINMSFGLGAFAGPLIAAAVLDAVHDYRPVFAGIALTLLVPVLVYALAPLPGPTGQPARGAAAVPPAWWPPVLLLAAVGFLYLGAEIGFGGWVFTYVQATSHTGVAMASWAPAGYWLALSAGSIGAALRPRAVRLEWLVFGCGIGSTLAGVLFVSGQGVWWQVGTATLLGLCLGPIYPLTIAGAAGLIPRAAGTVSGVVIASSQVGGAVMPWFQGLLLARGPGWGGAMTVLSCMALTLLQLTFIRVRAAMS